MALSLKDFIPGAYVRQRYVLAVMGFLAVVNLYSLRNVINLAFVRMVKEKTGIKADPDACPYDTSAHKHEEYGEFDWNEREQGFILAGFYWGYVITHLPGGLIAEKYGGKQTVGLSILISAILNLLTPAAARLGSGWLIFLRVVMGLAQGTTFPALGFLLAHWAPPFERGLIGSIVFAGNQIGTVASNILTGYILTYGTWPAVFYLFGTVGVIWYIAWNLTVFNDPSSHPYISAREKEFLDSHLSSIKKKHKIKAVPWSKIFTSMPVWAIIVAQLGHDWGLFTVITMLPKFMQSVMHFSIKDNGVVSSIPFLAMWVVALLSGWFSDFLLARNYLSFTVSRKLFTSVASVGPSVGVLAAAYVGCDKVAVTSMFVFGLSFMGFYYPSLKVNPWDLSPNFSGTLMAIANGMGALSGIVTPILGTHMVPNNYLAEWRIYFWTNFTAMTVTNIFYVIFATGNVQPWNELAETEETQADGKASTKL